jgi:serine/threonine-protein kinase HipA
MRTLCKERPGIYVQDYGTLAQVLRKHSTLPSADVAALFRYMVFNAAIGNVDDHLKNFWMLATSSGYRLAPAFDLVPDVTGRGEHTLSFQHGFACPTRAELAAVGDAWGVSQAAEIIDEITEAAGAFTATARKLKVRGGKTLENVQADVHRRLNLISTG